MSKLDQRLIHTGYRPATDCPNPEDCARALAVADQLIGRRSWRAASSTLWSHITGVDPEVCGNAHIWAKLALIASVSSPQNQANVAVCWKAAEACLNWTAGMAHDAARDKLLSELRRDEIDEQDIARRGRDLIWEAEGADDFNRAAIGRLVLAILYYRRRRYEDALATIKFAYRSLESVPPSERNQQWLSDIKFHELLMMARAGTPFMVRYSAAMDIIPHDRSEKRAVAALLLAIGGKSAAQLVEWYANKDEPRK